MVVHTIAFGHVLVVKRTSSVDSVLTDKTPVVTPCGEKGVRFGDREVSVKDF